MRRRHPGRNGAGIALACAAAWFLVAPSRAADPVPESVNLPALRLDGQPARAHTQGLEVVGGHYFVTARREDVRARRALLLRTDPTRSEWDVWDITPLDTQGQATTLDHPGGLQSDGTRLWIPVAESKRNGRTLIRVFPIAGLVSGQAPRPEREVPVDDHIGALAVSAPLALLLGASWDTERVYVWDLEGRLQRKLEGAELTSRTLGNGPSLDENPRRTQLGG